MQGSQQLLLLPLLPLLLPLPRQLLLLMRQQLLPSGLASVCSLRTAK
jgi:hypothetical protein